MRSVWQCTTPRVPVGGTVDGKIFLVMGGQLDVWGTTRISSAPYRCIRPREEHVACARADDARGGRCVLRRGQVHHCAGWHWHARDGAGDAAAARTAGAATTARTTRTNRRARVRARPRLRVRRAGHRSELELEFDTTTDIWTPLAPAPKLHSGYARCTAMASTPPTSVCAAVSRRPETRRSETTMYASTAGRMARVARHSPRTSGLPRSLRPAAIARGAAACPTANTSP